MFLNFILRNTSKKITTVMSVKENLPADLLRAKNVLKTLDNHCPTVILDMLSCLLAQAPISADCAKMAVFFFNMSVIHRSSGTFSFTDTTFIHKTLNQQRIDGLFDGSLPYFCRNCCYSVTTDFVSCHANTQNALPDQDTILRNRRMWL